ncbi:MAG: hypothetical protein LPJ93_00610 [Rhodobacterales bacterium]|nr:hypothetical protein [Rhodobacterales bacterium]MDX5400878.1 hypothetical protein [Rhodobacterales bacterium]
MAASFSYHSARGASDFLGLRRSRRGQTEIVYDDGVACRMVWRVVSDVPDEAPLREALESAVAEMRVLPALYAELKRRAIAIEAIAR